jgi:hypothetical protein
MAKSRSAKRRATASIIPDSDFAAEVLTAMTLAVHDVQPQRTRVFGVPHQGMEIKEILSVILETGGKSSTRLDLVQQLSEGSNFLNTQWEDIVNLWPTGSDIKIVRFYERRKSPTVKW